MKKHRPVSKVVCSLFALVAVATAEGSRPGRPEIFLTQH